MSFYPDSGAVLARTLYRATGNVQSLPDADQFSWTVDLAGDGAPPPLDLTFPFEPSFTEAGIYSISVAVSADVTHAGKNLWMGVALVDADGLNLTMQGYTPLDLDGVAACSGATYYLPAGQSIYVYVRHDIGAAADFRMNALIQRLAYS